MTNLVLSPKRNQVGPEGKNMKTKLLFLLGIFFWASFAVAEDVDIYGISEIDVKPNVLIILDNSGSMGTEDVVCVPYEPGDTYTGSYDGDMVYVKETIYQEVCHWVNGIRQRNMQTRRSSITRRAMKLSGRHTASRKSALHSTTLRRMKPS